MSAPVNIAGKDYLTTSEAAHYACVSASQFRKLAGDHGIAGFDWMGKTVYRKTDIRRAMEHEAAWQLSAKEATAGSSITSMLGGRSAKASVRSARGRPRKSANA